jgi:hypothetical protein
VLVGPGDGGAPQLGEHRRMRVAVVVVGTDRHDRGRRADRGEEAGRVRRAAVMGDLQDARAEPFGTAQQAGLRVGLGVAGEQDRTGVVADAQDEGVLVEVVRERAVGGRAEHLDERAPEREALAGGDGLERDGATARDRVCVDGAAREVGAGARRGGADDEGADVEPFEDARESAAVVGVRVGQGDDVEAGDAALAEQSQREAGVGAAVDEHSRRAVGAWRLDEQGVALADVEGGERERGHRRQGAQARERGEGDDDGDGEHRQARGAATGEDGDEQDRGDGGEQVLEAQGGARREQAGGAQDDVERGAGERGGGTAGGDRDLRDHGGRHADGRRDGGCGHRDEVGGQGRERDALGAREQHGRDADLRAHGRGDEQAQRRGARQARRQRGRDDEHARRGQHRQREAELGREQRVGQQQQQHGRREDVRGVAQAAGETGDQNERRHDRRAQHGRLGADEDREPGDRGEPEPAPPARPDAERTGEAEHPGQDQRDVGAGDGDEVREAGRGEVVGALDGLAAGVADDQAGEQRRAVAVEVACGGVTDAGADGGGDAQERTGRRERCDRAARLQEDRGVHAAQVPVEAVGSQRTRGRGQGDAGAGGRRVVDVVDAQRGAFADAASVHGGDARHEPAGGRLGRRERRAGGAGVREQRGLDARGASRRGKGGQDSPVAQRLTTAGEARAERDQRARRRREPRPLAEGRVRRAGEDGDADECEPPRRWAQAPQPQGGGQRERRRCRHTATSGAIAANSFSPMPWTSRSPATLVNGPTSSRWATMRAARTGPIPGSSSRSSAVARLRSSVPSGRRAETGEAGTAASLAAATGGAGPGTSSCSPSARGRARLSASSAASGRGPPAAARASATRAPLGRWYSPGLETSPATWTTISSAVTARPVGADGGGAVSGAGRPSSHSKPSAATAPPASTASARASAGAQPRAASRRRSERATRATVGPPRGAGAN